MLTGACGCRGIVTNRRHGEQRAEPIDHRPRKQQEHLGLGQAARHYDCALCAAKPRLPGHREPVEETPQSHPPGPLQGPGGWQQQQQWQWWHGRVQEPVEGLYDGVQEPVEGMYDGVQEPVEGLYGGDQEPAEGGYGGLQKPTKGAHRLWQPSSQPQAEQQ